MRRPMAVILLLVGTSLAGCIGGDGDGALAPSATMTVLDPDRDGSVPVPDTATMMDAERVANRDGSVTFLWRDTLGGQAHLARVSDEAAETTLTLPPGVSVQAAMLLTYERQGTEFGLEVEDSTGTVICDIHEHAVEDAREIAMTLVEDAAGGWLCGPTVPALDAPRTWTVRVTSDASLGEAPPFAVNVTLTAFEPVGPHLLDEVAPFEATADDGAALRGHVYLPDAPRPLPTILLFSPYWGAPSRPSDAYVFDVDGVRTMLPTLGVNLLLEAGYAVALVNMRGTGASEGCYSYMNLPRIGPDANAVIDAIAAEPWSDGNVGMHGISYLGAAQYAAIAYGPSPHLKATSAPSGHWDMWLAHSYYGVASLGTAFHAGYRNRQQGLGITFHPLDPLGVGVGAVTPHSWCDETPSPETAAWQLALDGDKVGWYAERDLSERMAGKDVPMMASFGLDGDGHIMETNGVWDVLTGPKRLFLGPWGHTAPTGDWQWYTRTQALPWLDHFVRGGAPVPTDRVDVQDDTGAWHVADQWPPQGQRVTLHLGDGTLTTQPAASTSERTIVNNDTNGPLGDGCAETDHAFFVSPPIVEDVVIAGNFLVNLTLTSTAPNGNVVAALVAVPDSAVCGEAWLDGKGLQLAIGDLRHRGHHELGEDYPVGTPDEVGLISVPLAETVPAGSRLLISVKAGMLGLAPKAFQPVLTLETGGDPPSTLAFTVVAGELRFEDA